MTSHYTVVLRQQKTSFPVERGESILEAAENHNVTLAYGCREGVCGTCRVRKVSGEITYGDINPLGLEEAYHSHVLCCCAVPQSDVILDL